MKKGRKRILSTVLSILMLMSTPIYALAGQVVEDSTTAELLEMQPAEPVAAEPEVNLELPDKCINDEDSTEESAAPKYTDTLFAQENILPLSENWNIVDHAFPATLGGPNTNWRIVTGTGQGMTTSDWSVTPNVSENYVNVTKTGAPSGGGGGWHAWVASPSNPATFLPAGGDFTVEATIRVHEMTSAHTVGNKFGIRFGPTGTPILMEVYIGYGGPNEGFVSLTPDGSGPFTYFLDTRGFVDYRMVVHDTNTFSMYVNGVLAFANAPQGTDTPGTGGNIVKFGAESRHVCNMDIAAVRIANTQLIPIGATETAPVVISESSRTVEAGGGGRFPLRAAGSGPITFTLENAPAGVTIEQVLTFPGRTELVIPSTVTSGVYNFTIRATNTQGESTQTFTLTVAGDAGDWTWERNLFPDFTANNWRFIRGGSSNATTRQGTSYANITSNQIASGGTWAWIATPVGFNLPASGAFTFETRARVHPSVNPAGNKLSIRFENQWLAEVYIGYGEHGGFVSNRASGDTEFTFWLDTTVFNDYRLIVSQDRLTFSLYVNGILAFEGAPRTLAVPDSRGADLWKMGAESWNSCNMDIEIVRYAERAVVPYPVLPAIRSATIDETNFVNDEPITISVEITTSATDDGTAFNVELVDAARNPLSPRQIVSGTITDNTGTVQLTLPAEFATGRYFVRVEMNNMFRFSAQVRIDYPRGPQPEFPVFLPVGFTIEIDDYLFPAPVHNEFQFPQIIDTNNYPQLVNPIARYYLFYSPHGGGVPGGYGPGGIFLKTSDCLFGPWTEHPNNPLIVREDVPTSSHISASHVIWNEGLGLFVKYFHGPNHITRYTTSSDLVNWTMGGIAVQATDFRAGGNEASYGRVFLHEVPGLGNRYVMLLMVFGSGMSGRAIYWAHSQDGINWTPVTTPLLTPDNSLAPDGVQYHAGAPGITLGGANLSGPTLYVQYDPRVGGNRYFVMAHSSYGNIHLFEIGENFDREIHWGNFYERTGPNIWPDEGRAGAPSFIRDDEGVWHMFYESGRRLHYNIMHAIETRTITPSAGAGGEIYPYAEQRVFRGTIPQDRREHVLEERDFDGQRVFTITPDYGFEVDTVLVNGEAVTLTDENTFTFARVMEDSIIHVTFREETPELPPVQPPDDNGDEDDEDDNDDDGNYDEDNNNGETPPNDTPPATGGGGGGGGGAGLTPPQNVQPLPDPEVPTTDPPVETTREFLFADVSQTHWAREAIELMFELGIMNGVSETAFAPNTNLSRAMAATILFRLSGESPVDFDTVFPDVASGRWYSYGVIWAYQNDIVRGLDSGRFSPADDITREQFVAMLHRYAVASGADVAVSPSFDLAEFYDADTISPWAVPYMQWAVYTGLVIGTDASTLNPLSSTTRAEFAVIIKRLLAA